MLVKGSEEKGCAVISDVWRWSDVVSSELNLITSVGILNWFKKKKALQKCLELRLLFPRGHMKVMGSVSNDGLQTNISGSESVSLKLVAPG